MLNIEGSLTEFALMIFLRFALIGFIIVSIFYVIRIILWSRVKLKSTYYKDMKTLKENSEYHHIETEYTFYTQLDSKRRFDNYDLRVSLRNLIRRNKKFLDRINDKAEFNKKVGNEYITEVRKIENQRIKDGTPKTLMPSFLFKYIEKKIVKEVIISDLVTHPIIKLYKFYTSPAGRNHYEKYRDFSLTEVETEYKMMLINDKKAKHYKETVEYQRNLMTPSLRYDILKRDKFACQICGYSKEDGVKLHVDHIVPVSKGGKSHKRNLRTLCSDCNFGKSDKFDPTGIN